MAQMLGVGGCWEMRGAGTPAIERRRSSRLRVVLIYDGGLVVSRGQRGQILSRQK